MEGHTHATSGAVAYLVAVPLLVEAGVQASPLAIGVGVVAAAGGAMAPDWDHPSATFAHSFPLVTMPLSRFVSFISGGHRWGTHSLIGAGAFTWLTGAAIAAQGLTWHGHAAGRGALALWLTLLAHTGLIGLGITPSSRRTTYAAAMAAGLWWLAGSALMASFPTGVLPWAVAIGVLAHIAGDALTKEGVPLFYPFSRRRFRLATITTGSSTEKAVSLCLGIIGIYLLVQVTGQAPTVTALLGRMTG